MTDPDSSPDSTRRAAAGSTRASRWIRGIALAVIVLGLLAIGRALPIDRAIDLLRERVGELGATGILLFGLAYVVAALLFVPGSALTLGAGALFGLLRGTLVVSVASTTAAALAYLIARHLARERVEALAARYPRFRSIDSAIGEQGWKIVLLLRLSPAFPYSASNYVYGLTAVRFWPLVLASWVGMLPGTFLYVYLGHAGTAAFEGGRSTGEWVLLGVGLAATVAVTALVTRIAVRALRRDALEDGGGEAETRREDADDGPSLASTVTLAAGAAAVAVAAGFAWRYRAPLQGVFGPPAVELREAHAGEGGDASFDHGTFDALLAGRVDDEGRVDYAGLARDPDRLDGYLGALASADLDALGRDERLALLINAYNAFTLRLILDHWPVASIRDIPVGERWDDARWELAGDTVSLNQLEHERIRPAFREPRIHFALVCAAVGCPPLRRQAYAGGRIEAQLADQAERVHASERWFRVDPERNVVHLIALYDWYGGDFEQVAGSVLEYAARYSPALADALAAGRAPEIEWIDYDWSLNAQEPPR